MNDPSIGLVLLRLDELERKNRRMKWMTVLLLIGIGTVALTGQAVPGDVAKVLEAEEFVVRDADGKKRAELGVSSDGKVHLSLLGGSGERRANLVVDSSGSSNLKLGDEEQKNTVQLSWWSHVFSGLAIYNQDGEIAVNLSQMKGAPNFILHDKSARTVLMGMTPPGDLILANYHTEGGPSARLVMGLTPQGVPLAVLIDKNEKVYWRTP